MKDTAVRSNKIHIIYIIIDSVKYNNNNFFNELFLLASVVIYTTNSSVCPSQGKSHMSME